MTDDCYCDGCRADNGCYWPRGVTGQAPPDPDPPEPDPPERDEPVS